MLDEGLLLRIGCILEFEFIDGDKKSKDKNDKYNVHEHY